MCGCKTSTLKEGQLSRVTGFSRDVDLVAERCRVAFDLSAVPAGAPQIPTWVTLANAVAEVGGRLGLLGEDGFPHHICCTQLNVPLAFTQQTLLKEGVQPVAIVWEE
jgi:hypothetical protein